MTDTAVQMDDSALFDAAMSEAPATPEPSPEPQPEPQATDTAGQARNADGTFAARANAEPEPQPAAQPTSQAAPTDQVVNPDTGTVIPKWRFDEINAEKKELKQQLDRVMRQLQQPPRQPEPPKPRPDFFENPDAATAHVVESTVNPVIRGLQQQVMHMGRMTAQAIHGAEKVEAADKAFTDAHESGQLDPVEAQRVLSAPNIYDAAVAWHKQQQVRQRIGNDLDGFLAKRDEELLNDPAFMAKVADRLRAGQQPGQAPANGQRPSTPVVLPPSLNRVTAASPNTPDAIGDLSNASLFAHATA